MSKTGITGTEMVSELLIIVIVGLYHRTKGTDETDPRVLMILDGLGSQITGNINILTETCRQKDYDMDAIHRTICLETGSASNHSLLYEQIS